MWLGQNGCCFADNIDRFFVFQGILIQMSLMFVPESPVVNKPTLVQIMAWCRTGTKPLFEPMMHCEMNYMYSLFMDSCVTSHRWVNTLRPRQNGRHFCRRHFHVHFLEWKLSNFKWNFIEICYLGSNWQLTIIDSGNGLSPNRWQAIFWTNDGIVYWCIYASHGPIDLMYSGNLIRLSVLICHVLDIISNDLFQWI